MKSYQAGVGDYLSVLTAQRTLWSAKTTLLSLQQTDLNNRITLLAVAGRRRQLISPAGRRARLL